MNTLDTGIADKSTDNVDKPCEICTSRADSNIIGRGVGRFKAYCKSLMLRLTQRVVAKHSKGNTKARARNCKAVKKNSFAKSKKGLIKSGSETKGNLKTDENLAQFFGRSDTLSLKNDTENCKDCNQKDTISKWAEMKVSALIYKYTQDQMQKEINHKLDKHVSCDSFDIELPNIVEDQLNNPSTDEPEIEADGDSKSDCSKISDDNSDYQIYERIESLKVSVTGKSLSMMCPICHQFIYKACCTSCMHMFCSYGIEEYMLFRDTCPLCEKKIRGTKNTKGVIVDLAIEKLLLLSANQNYEIWRRKKLRDDLYFENRKITAAETNFNLTQNHGLKIDVRDHEYIWCQAEITAMIQSKDSENQLLIHFKGWDKKYDELIPISSQRLAKLGFYTSRKDIPYYVKGANKNKKPCENINSSSLNYVKKVKRLLFKKSTSDDDNTSMNSDQDIDSYYEEIIKQANNAVKQDSNMNAQWQNTSRSRLARRTTPPIIFDNEFSMLPSRLRHIGHNRVEIMLRNAHNLLNDTV